MRETVKIVGQYSEGCFCNRPEGFTPLTGVKYRPFQFARPAKEFAARNGLRWGGLNKYKSAWAIRPVPCQHRPEQHVRISWELEY
jgi:hypothetical protein